MKVKECALKCQFAWEDCVFPPPQWLWRWVLACGWHLSHCPRWNPWHQLTERKLGLSMLPTGHEWVVQKYAARIGSEKIQYTVVFWTGGEQCLLTRITGLAKEAWNDAQSRSISHLLVIKPEECGYSVSGFSFLYTLWGSNSDWHDLARSLSVSLSRSHSLSLSLAFCWLSSVPTVTYNMVLHALSEMKGISLADLCFPSVL